MKQIFFAATLLACLATGYLIAVLAPSLRMTPTGTPELTARIVLYKQYPDGSLRETGVNSPYDVTGIYPGASSMWLSPEKNKVVYTAWEDAHVFIYAEDIGNSGIRKIAEQKAPEGSGGLDANSITWSDNDHITYIEEGLRCEKKTCINPGDFTSAKTMYSVDVNSSI